MFSLRAYLHIYRKDLTFTEKIALLGERVKANTRTQSVRLPKKIEVREDRKTECGHKVVLRMELKIDTRTKQEPQFWF